MNDNDYYKALLNINYKDYLASKWEWDTESSFKKEDLMKIIYDYSDLTKGEDEWGEDSYTLKKKAAPKETDDQKVIRILKGDFEKKFGMTFEKFIETYHGLLETSPEKLI